MALSADFRTDFTTIADFISGSSDEIAKLFHQVLMIYDDLGLIAKAVRHMLTVHREEDRKGENDRKRSTAHLLQGQQIVAVVGLDLQRLRRTFD
nr:hypothetical protein [Pelobacter seleniigenes]